jgi:hypothetical protein
MEMPLSSRSLDIIMMLLSKNSLKPFENVADDLYIFGAILSGGLE